MANHVGSSNAADLESPRVNTHASIVHCPLIHLSRFRQHLRPRLIRRRLDLLLGLHIPPPRDDRVRCVAEVILVSLLCPLYITFFLIFRPHRILDKFAFELLKSIPEQEGKEEKDVSIKRKPTGIKYKLHELSIVSTARMGCLVLMWMVINLSVPSLKRVIFLGSLLWKWSLLVALILLTYPLLIVPLHSRLLLRVIGESNVAYCMMGLDRSVTLLAYFTSILLAWLLFIDTKNPDLRHYGTLTLASFLIGAVLSVVKSVVILLWKTNLIYNRYEGKILSAGCQLYFHLLIMNRWVPGMGILFQLDKKRRKSEGQIKDHSEQRGNRWKTSPVEEFMLEQGASLPYIDLVATYLTTYFELSLTENDDIPDIVPYLRMNFASFMQQPRFTIKNDMSKISSLSYRSSSLLHELLQLETSKEVPSYEDFEKWMVEGLKNCYASGHRINGAMEVKETLDRVLTGLIIVLVFLVWLFITGFATTRVVVGLGSIFIGLTFIFGDTCKMFFQGVIFSFVNHPFDVADHCIIDNEQLRVKKINILTTSFFGNQARETIIYPNSELATKRIVILHGEPKSKPKPSMVEDDIEFILPCSTDTLPTKLLQEKVEGFLEDGIYKKHNCGVSLKEIGGNIKMGVHFQHDLNDERETWKEKQVVLFQLWKFVENVIGKEIPPPQLRLV